MEDYFALLDLSRDASTAEIDARIKQQVRTWQRRTTNPDLSRRQEAERRIRLLAEARDVLLDERRREDYVAELTRPAQPADVGEASEPPRSAPPRALADWLAQARAHLAKGDYPAALHAAREARRADGQSAEAWALLARAESSMDSLQNALTAARRASDLDPSNPGYYFVQGRVHERLGQLADAKRCYEVATRLNPDAEAPKLAMANIVALGDRPEEAVELLEDIFGRSDDKRQPGLALGTCLVRVAERVPQRRTKDGFLITSADEVDAMERLLFRARQVTRDAETVRRVEALADHVRWAKDRHVRKLTVVTGAAGVAAVVAALAGVVLLFSFLTGPSLAGAILTLGCLGAAGGYAWWVWTPGHVLNRRTDT